MFCSRNDHNRSSVPHLEVKLAVEEIAVLVDQAVGVAAVAIHVAVPIWCTTVREHEEVLMHRFRSQGHEVPEHVGVLFIS